MLRILTLLLLLLCGGASAQSDDANPLAPMDLSSPRATYLSFLDSSRRLERRYLDYRAEKTPEGAKAIFDGLRRSSRAFDLSATPRAQRGEVSAASSTYLFDILMRLPEIDPAVIPGGEGEKLPESWTIPGTEIEIQRIAEGPRADEYVFSADTIARLPSFHDRAMAMPLQRRTAYSDWGYELMAHTGPMFDYEAVDSLPESLQRPFLGTLVWKALLTVAIWAAIVGATVGWGLLVSRIVRDGQSIGGLALRMTVPAALAALVWIAHDFAIHQSSLAGAFASGEVVATTVALYVAFAWFAVLLFRFVVELIIALPAIPDQSYDAHLLRLVARVGGLAAAGVVLVYGADRLGIPALGLIAGVGVGGVALALAAQSTVENLFGGISIFVDRPFRIGDFIQYGGGSGTVEAIGPRSSRVRGLDGTLTTVPNSDLAKMHIVNYSARNKCLFVKTLGLRYETTRLQLEWILATMRSRLSAHPMVEETPGMPRVRLTDFGASAIEVEIRAHVLTADFGKFLEIQEELLLELQEIVESGGSGFAYPSQTLYLGRDGGLDAEARQRAETAALEARGRREIGAAAAAR